VSIKFDLTEELRAVLGKYLGMLYSDVADSIANDVMEFLTSKGVPYEDIKSVEVSCDTSGTVSISVLYNFESVYQDMNVKLMN
jgi:hypothetical protein